MTTTLIRRLQHAILRIHGCDAQHVESVTIEDFYHGEVVWKGVVEVFALNHGRGPRRCFAWSHPHGHHGEQSRYFAVLEAPGVESPLQAVRSSMANDYRRTDSTLSTG
jgi:hypothetical protein